MRFTNGTGPQALDLAHAIEYAVEMGACIVNISPIGEVGESAVQRAIQYAAARNVLVVCSAPDASSPVAMADDDRVPNQINVLSIGEEWQPMASCARQSAHLAAPGFARVPQWRGSGHSTLLGNAIGAPYVSGCAALVKTLNPAWGYHEIKEHLLASGDHASRARGQVPDGRVLNVANAVLGPHRARRRRAACSAGRRSTMRCWNGSCGTARRCARMWWRCFGRMAMRTGASSPSRAPAR